MVHVLVQRLHDGTGPHVFLQEAQMDLTPYLNSSQACSIEGMAGEFT